jgi:uncharacterized protein (TIGR00725 family)
MPPLESSTRSAARDDTPTPRRPMAAVVGPAAASEQTQALAFELGRCLVDAGFRVVTGGLSGCMSAVCEGAHASIHYRDGDVIGILPTYQAASANPWVDIVIPTGLGHARNVLVAASGDVVLALAGKAGTLSEIAMAWTLNKPVIAVGQEPGWASQLAGAPLDDRRADFIHGPLMPSEAARLAAELVLAGIPPAREFT